ncbi:hypothetical protein [Cutibacterium granulosum]|nr:hypothetical protein [Cutibacterium granulosum]MDU1523113.1 hypothetical protein [Cutibacterium granulosum]MDU4678286.1 hypothetical protein [Cutibacterium granulosum]MDU7727687.1 hypothetical protein [Cutibacterium granulosum]
MNMRSDRDVRIPVTGTGWRGCHGHVTRDHVTNSAVREFVARGR